MEEVAGGGSKLGRELHSRSNIAGSGYVLGKAAPFAHVGGVFTALCHASQASLLSG